jgi:hypothetical protein
MGSGTAAAAAAAAVGGGGGGGDDDEEDSDDEDEDSSDGPGGEGGASGLEGGASGLKDLSAVVRDLMEQQRDGGGFHAFTTVRQLCVACGVTDEQYIQKAEAYDSKVNELVGNLRILLRSFGILLAEDEMSEDPSPPPSITPEQIRARVEMVRQRYRASNLVSVFELGPLLLATAIAVEGFPVSVDSEDYISPLLSSDGSALADSMVLSALFHLLLPQNSTLRIDISTMVGHWRAWDDASRQLKKLRKGEAAVCLETARHVLGGGFRHIVSDGRQSEDAIAIQRRAGMGGRETHHCLDHPSLLLPKAVGDLNTILGLAEDYEKVARALGSRFLPPSGPGPMQEYLSAITAGLAKEGGKSWEFDSVKATKTARATEIRRKKRTPWAKLPPLVRAEVILRTGKTSDAGFDEMGWRARSSDTKEPSDTPLCWYRSIHGVVGGASSWGWRWGWKEGNAYARGLISRVEGCGVICMVDRVCQ